MLNTVVYNHLPDTKVSVKTENIDMKSSGVHDLKSSSSKVIVRPRRIVVKYGSKVLASAPIKAKISESVDINLFRPIIRNFRPDDNQNFRNMIYEIPSLRIFNLFNDDIIVNTNIVIPANSFIDYKGTMQNGIPQGFEMNSFLRSSGICLPKVTLVCPVDQVVYGAITVDKAQNLNSKNANVLYQSGYYGYS